MWSAPLSDTPLLCLWSHRYVQTALYVSGKVTETKATQGLCSNQAQKDRGGGPSGSASVCNSLPLPLRACRGHCQAHTIPPHGARSKHWKWKTMHSTLQVSHSLTSRGAAWHLIMSWSSTGSVRSESLSAVDVLNSFSKQCFPYIRTLHSRQNIAQQQRSIGKCQVEQHCAMLAYTQVFVFV